MKAANKVVVPLKQPAKRPPQIIAKIEKQLKVPIYIKPETPTIVKEVQQFKSYFIPAIRSKYLTYELLGYLYEYVYEVVILLRSLNKQSSSFKDHLIDDIKQIFSQSKVIKLQPSLKLAGVFDREKVDASQSRALNSYFHLQRIKDFEELFKMQLCIEILDYQMYKDCLDHQQISQLIGILSNKDNEYDNVAITVDTDHPPKCELLEDNEIIQFLHSLSQHQIMTKELRFNRVNVPFIEYALAYQYHKNVSASNRFFQSVMGSQNVQNNSVWFNGMKLEVFVIEKTNLTIQSMQYLQAILANCINIRSLSLEDIASLESMKDPNFLNSLVETLKSISYLQQLRELNLSRNHLMDDFIKGLIPILKQTKIEVLDLSSNRLSDEGILQLCPYLYGNQHIKILNLNYSKFSELPTSKEFVTALEQCPRLEEVHLKLCRISDALMEELSKIITPRLKILNLSHNKLTKDGIGFLKEHLLRHKTGGSQMLLHTLSLKSNELNDFCFDAIREIVDCCPKLKVFDVSENMFYSSYKLLVVLQHLSKVSFKQ